ncbi:hypothetical protein [Pseudonocardia pini]|uniref:hypothetical protein n=1 Tax=Pseudonocardia pini TaxID=2758030 RepID=UPI0015F0BCB8|nr:hypothetical protein [Pseudonocardia pini]
MTTTENPHAALLVVHASTNGGTAGIATTTAATTCGFLATRTARGERAGGHRDPERVRAWARDIALAPSPVGRGR